MLLVTGANFIMECNKDEATRAMSIADSKLLQKDFLSAKKFVLKAQNLYPGLHGIPQILTTLDVHIAAENKIRGEVDWYRVLDTNPSADYDAIKKQYRKLALMLHPDKNKSAGAESAFKLISEAWRLLSDEEKRAAYNQRRGNNGVQLNVLRNTGAQQKVPSASRKKKAPSAPAGRAPPHYGGSSAASMENPFFTYGSRAKSTMKRQNGSAKKARAEYSAPPPRRPDAFWTACYGCNAHFEYYNVYKNHTLLCRRCGMGFLALEKAPPPKSVPWVRGESSPKNVPGQNANDPKGDFAAAQNPVADQTIPNPNYQQSPWVRGESSLKNVPGQNANDPKGNFAAAQNPGAEQTIPNQVPVAAAQNPGAEHTIPNPNYQQVPVVPVPEPAFIDSRYPSTAEKPGNVQQPFGNYQQPFGSYQQPFGNYQQVSDPPGTAYVDSSYPSTAEKPGSVQQPFGDMKRSYVDAFADLGGCFEKGKQDDDINSYATDYFMDQGISGFGFASAYATGSFGFSGVCTQPSSSIELTPPESRNLLPHKAQDEIQTKLGGYRF